MATSRARLRFLVAARADGRCEYWRRYQDLMGDSFFEVEHIIPVAHGRTTIGRATVALLRLNSPGEQRARKIQRDHLGSLFPLN